MGMCRPTFGSLVLKGAQNGPLRDWNRGKARISWTSRPLLGLFYYLNLGFWGLRYGILAVFATLRGTGISIVIFTTLSGILKIQKKNKNGCLTVDWGENRFVLNKVNVFYKALHWQFEKDDWFIMTRGKSHKTSFQLYWERTSISIEFWKKSKSCVYKPSRTRS